MAVRLVWMPSPNQRAPFGDVDYDATVGAARNASPDRSLFCKSIQ